MALILQYINDMHVFMDKYGGELIIVIIIIVNLLSDNLFP